MALRISLCGQASIIGIYKVTRPCTNQDRSSSVHKTQVGLVEVCLHCVSVRWWSKLTGHLHLSRAVHGGARTAKIQNEMGRETVNIHMSKITAALLEIKTEAFLTPTLRVQKAAPLALTSFRLDTIWKEESPCPSVYPAGMAYAGGLFPCSKIHNANLSVSNYSGRAPQSKMQSTGLGQLVTP